MTPNATALLEAAALFAKLPLIADVTA